jgi:hypothetical protein
LQLCCALLTSTPQGATGYGDADMHEPDKILEAAVRTLDLGKPVAVIFMGVLGHIVDYDQARSIVRRLLELVEPGVVSVPTWRPDPADGPAAELDAFGGVGRRP